MSPSSTKRGPGRKHRQGDGRRVDVRSRYVQGLLNHWAKKRSEARPKVGGGPRDEHGAVTLIGQQYELIGVKPTAREFVLAGGKTVGGESFYLVQRIWLGGISAQRGW